MFLPTLVPLVGFLALFTSPAEAVKTYNVKMAASLSSVAVKIPHGSYTITNVATGNSLYYTPNKNAIYPAKSASKVTITPHSNTNWVRLQFGGKNKCLSSAWGGSYNNAAVMYMCAVGSTGVRTTLEPTKQWWLAVNVKKTKGNSKASTAVLFAAQQESVNTRNKKIAAARKAFNNRLSKRDVPAESALVDPNAEETLAAELTVESEEAWEEQLQLQKRGTLEPRRRRRKSHKKSKKSSKKSSSRGGKVLGTFYLVPSDHLIDQQTRALTSSIFNSRGVKTTAIQPYKAGNKSQQWIITKY